MSAAMDVRVRLRFFLLFSLLCTIKTAKISDMKLCADRECQETISKAQALANYSPNDPVFLPFKRGTVILIKSKSAGSRPDLWSGEANGARGYFPYAFVREFDVLHRKLDHTVPTEKHLTPGELALQQEQKHAEANAVNSQENVQKEIPKENIVPPKEEAVNEKNEEQKQENVVPPKEELTEPVMTEGDNKNVVSMNIDEEDDTEVEVETETPNGAPPSTDGENEVLLPKDDSIDDTEVDETELEEEVDDDDQLKDQQEVKEGEGQPEVKEGEGQQDVKDSEGQHDVKKGEGQHDTKPKEDDSGWSLSKEQTKDNVPQDQIDDVFFHVNDISADREDKQSAEDLNKYLRNTFSGGQTDEAEKPPQDEGSEKILKEEKVVNSENTQGGTAESASPSVDEIPKDLGKESLDVRLDEDEEDSTEIKDEEEEEIKEAEEEILRESSVKHEGDKQLPTNDALVNKVQIEKPLESSEGQQLNENLHLSPVVNNQPLTPEVPVQQDPVLVETTEASILAVPPITDKGDHLKPTETITEKVPIATVPVDNKQPIAESIEAQKPTNDINATPTQAPPTVPKDAPGDVTSQIVIDGTTINLNDDFENSLLYSSPEVSLQSSMHQGPMSTSANMDEISSTLSNVDNALNSAVKDFADPGIHNTAGVPENNLEKPVANITENIPENPKVNIDPVVSSTYQSDDHLSRKPLGLNNAQKSPVVQQATSHDEPSASQSQIPGNPQEIHKSGKTVNQQQEQNTQSSNQQAKLPGNPQQPVESATHQSQGFGNQQQEPNANQQQVLGNNQQGLGSIGEVFENHKNLEDMHTQIPLNPVTNLPITDNEEVTTHPPVIAEIVPPPVQQEETKPTSDKQIFQGEEVLSFEDFPPPENKEEGFPDIPQAEELRESQTKDGEVPPVEDSPYQTEPVSGRKITDGLLGDDLFGTPPKRNSFIDRTFRPIINKMPSSIQNILEKELLGLSPALTVLMIITTVIILTVTTCCGCTGGGGKKTTDALVVVRKLEEKLFIATKEKENLEDSLTEAQTEIGKYEKQLTNHQSKSGTYKADLQNLQLHNESLKQKVTSLTTQLEEYNEEVKEIQGTSHGKDKKVKDLEKQINKLDERAKKAEKALEKKSKEVTDNKEEVETKRNQMKSLSDQVQLLETSKQQLLSQASDWKEKVDDLNERLNQTEEEYKQMQETVSFKDSELEVLKECFLQLKAFEDENEMKEDPSDTVTAVQDKLQTMIDVGKVNATLRAVQDDRDTLSNKLDIETEARQEVEDQLDKVRLEMESFQADKMKADRQLQESQTKLNVLSNYFKEKEMQLQRELGEQEVLKKQNINKLNSADEKSKQTEDERVMYKQQVESLKRELEAADRDFRSQIAANEQKAHENWIAARTAERELKESRHQNTTLRQRLTDLSRKPGPDGLIRPLPTRGMPPPGMLNGPPMPLPSGMDRPPERSPSRGSIPPPHHPPRDEFYGDRLPPHDRRLPPGPRLPPPIDARSPGPYDRRPPPPHLGRRTPPYRPPHPDMMPPYRGPHPMRDGIASPPLLGPPGYDPRLGPRTSSPYTRPPAPGRDKAPRQQSQV